jgi:HK97 family phage prohead protease
MTTPRNLAVVRSAAAPVLLAEPVTPESDTVEPLADETPVVRASWRAAGDIASEDPLMKVEFSRFGNWYEVDSVYEGRFLERVVPGSFTKTINERGGQVKVLFNHGMDNQIGDKVLGPIRMLEERETGAYAEVGMLDTSYNRDLIPGLRAQVYGSSFMFNVMDDVWDDAPARSTHNPDGIPQRTITAVRLLEFGPVTWPANPQASAGMRSDTDRYYDDLRSRSPEQYDLVNTAFGEFRSSHATAMVTIMVDACTSDEDEDEAVDPVTGLPIEEPPMDPMDTSLNEAAPAADASEEARHATEFQGINSETRRARLQLAGVLSE